MKRLSTTPTADGFAMPGEFEPHVGCWVLWPERPDNWRQGAKPAQAAFADVVRGIAQFEPVTVGVSAAQYDNAVNQLPNDVRVVEISNNDSWVRDCGPTFVKNQATGEVRGVDWEFNAWGGLFDGLYFPWDRDDQVARKICELERVDSYRTEGFVLEGGSIHSDGEGTIYTTEECLLSPGRNPDHSKAEIEAKLKEYLGAEKVIWLRQGIYLDETNGHVDNICCVVEPGKVLLAWTDDESDPQYAISQENYDILTRSVDAKGRQIEVVKLPLPKPITITEEESKGVDAVDGTLPRLEGDRLAASYVNFYIANGGLVVPAFGDPADQLAVSVLEEVFPGRTVVSVPAREILLGGGNIHCITQQQPA
ncbi:MAG: agmatine deiminase [Bifidobacteriaceae bacterium]|nr:agmatine deiminase [Bifidobacteriaceae bacterium]